MSFKLISTNKRELCFLPKDTTFTADVWLHLIKRASHLSYTEKKYLTNIIHRILRRDYTAYITVKQIISKIRFKIEDYVNIINGIQTASYQKRVKVPSWLNDLGEAVISSDRTIMSTNVQKLIRHGLKDILTERDIRQLTNETRHAKFKHLYQSNLTNDSNRTWVANMYTWHITPDKFATDCDIHQSMLDYMDIVYSNQSETTIEYCKWHYNTANLLYNKIFMFHAKMYRNVIKGFQQYLHFADVKHLHSMNNSTHNFEFRFMNMHNHSVMSKFPAYHRISKLLQSIDLGGGRPGNCFFIGFDKGMLKYSKYSIHLNPDTADIPNSFISRSLHSTLLQACKYIETRKPKKIPNAQAQVDYAIAWQYFNLLSKHQCSIQHDRHFTINNRGQCTYTPAGKPTILTSNFTWLSGNGRQVTKFGKAIKKLLAYKLIDIPDYAIEIIQNHIKSVYTFTDTFKIVEGSDITKYYHYQTYSNDNTGSLSSSCMRYDSCTKFFDLYEKHCKLLISLNEDGHVTGRALIWKLNASLPESSGVQEITFMDRIYGNDKTISAFKGYAEKNNMYYKRYQSYEEGELLYTPQGDECDLTLWLQIPYDYPKYVPYVDTMKHAYVNKTFDTVTLTNRVDKIREWHVEEWNKFILTSTSGQVRGFTGMHEHRQSHPTVEGMVIINETEYPEDECRWSETHSEWIHESEAVFAEDVNDYIYHDDSVWLEDEGEYHTEFSEDVVFNESTQQHAHIRNCTLTHDSSGNAQDYYSNDDTVYDEWEDFNIHIDDSHYCEVTGSYTHIDNTENMYHSLDTNQEGSYVLCYTNTPQEDIDSYLEEYNNDNGFYTELLQQQNQE